MDGYADELLIEYDGEEKHLSYCIVKKGRTDRKDRNAMTIYFTGEYI